MTTDEPVQTDKPTFKQLLAAAKAHRSITVRQIGARASNMHMVGGFPICRKLVTRHLDDIFETHGESALRELATDDTIEVFIVGGVQ